MSEGTAESTPADWPEYVSVPRTAANGYEGVPYPARLRKCLSWLPAEKRDLAAQIEIATQIRQIKWLIAWIAVIIPAAVIALIVVVSVMGSVSSGAPVVNPYLGG